MSRDYAYNWQRDYFFEALDKLERRKNTALWFWEEPPRLYWYESWRPGDLVICDGRHGW